MAFGDEPGPYPPLYGESPGQISLERLRELERLRKKEPHLYWQALEALWIELHVRD